MPNSWPMIFHRRNLPAGSGFFFFSLFTWQRRYQRQRTKAFHAIKWAATLYVLSLFHYTHACTTQITPFVLANAQREHCDSTCSRYCCNLNILYEAENPISLRFFALRATTLQYYCIDEHWEAERPISIRSGWLETGSCEIVGVVYESRRYCAATDCIRAMEGFVRGLVGKFMSIPTSFSLI